jgi:hypothetical protein
MIFCVVPEELAPDLYDQLSSYYADDAHVEVIIDRRKSERRDGQAENGSHRRELRDRRRSRVPGEFPQLDPE